jgi:hypothetical protein
MTNEYAFLFAVGAARSCWCLSPGLAKTWKTIALCREYGIDQRRCAAFRFASRNRFVAAEMHTQPIGALASRRDADPHLQVVLFAAVHARSVRGCLVGAGSMGVGELPTNLVLLTASSGDLHSIPFHLSW